jgi:hypothetical protein
MTIGQGSGPLFGRGGDLSPVMADGSPREQPALLTASQNLSSARGGTLPRPPTNRNAPDVLIFVASPRRALIAIEVKMYDRPTAAKLNDQLTAQATLVGTWWSGSALSHRTSRT